MDKVRYYFKLWLKREWNKHTLKMYFDAYADENGKLEWFDQFALDALLALAED